MSIFTVCCLDQGWAGKDFGAFPLLAFAVAGKGKDFSLPAGQGISLPATKSVADGSSFLLPATKSVAGTFKFLLPETNSLCRQRYKNLAGKDKLTFPAKVTFSAGNYVTLLRNLGFFAGIFAGNLASN